MDDRLAARLLENNFVVKQKTLADRVSLLEKLSAKSAADLRATFDLLYAPIAHVSAHSPHGDVSFRVTKNGTNQTGVSGTGGTNTKLTWSTELWDTDNWFASDKYTPQVAGKYLFGISAYFEAMTDQVNYGTVLYKNGSIYSYCSLSKSSGTGGHGTNGSTLVDMNGTTDYVEAYVFQESGSNQTVIGLATLTYFYGSKQG